MDEDNEELDDSIVENLVWFLFGHVLFSDILFHELKQITQQLKVQVPVLVLFENGGEEVLVGDELDPGKCEIGVESGINLMKFFGQNVVKGSDFLFGEIVLFAGGVADQVKEELEERALEVACSLL